jgi:hypothetical protein
MPASSGEPNVSVVKKMRHKGAVSFQLSAVSSEKKKWLQHKDTIGTEGTGDSLTNTGFFSFFVSTQTWSGLFSG